MVRRSGPLETDAPFLLPKTPQAHASILIYPSSSFHNLTSFEKKSTISCLFCLQDAISAFNLWLLVMFGAAYRF